MPKLSINFNHDNALFIADRILSQPKNLKKRIVSDDIVNAAVEQYKDKILRDKKLFGDLKREF